MRAMHPLLARWIQFRDYLSDDFLGGPKVVKFAWSINLQKGSTLFFVLALMVYFGDFSATAWTYAALHGSYGFIWVYKDMVFPDPGWQRKLTIGGAINTWVLALGLYWLAPTLLITRRYEATPLNLGATIFVYALGVVLMTGSDAQKFFMLRERKGLITDGFFSRTRNPNYLGEMMVYGSFAALSGHWIPWVVLAWVWGGVFIPNMLRKDASLSRYPEWAAYQARTGLLIPRLFQRADSKPAVHRA
jgi:protein-S-isoprenylcysteine O-methyltransferase Ste14